MKRATRTAALMMMGLVLLASASAQAATSIAYINNNSKNVDYLGAYGYAVTYLNDPIGLTAGQLAGYDAVLVASNRRFSEQVGVGNALADYADAGGGVVLCQFSWQGSYGLFGEIMSADYAPFSRDPSGTGYGITSTSLGTVYDASHPLLAGVNPANVPTYWQANVGLNAGATLVADWPTGRHAIAWRDLDDSRIVGLNLFPATYSSYQAMTPDSQRLVANSLGYSIGADMVPAVPVPGAVLLGSLGVSLVGWLRRRRSL